MLKRIIRALMGRDHAPPELWSPWDRVILREERLWKDAVAASREGPRILMGLTAGGYHVGALVESLLAVALTLRGARVDVLLCDSALPACQMTEIGNSPPDSIRAAPPQPRCPACERRGKTVFGPLGLDIRWLGSLADPPARDRAKEIARSLDLERAAEFELDGLAAGEHAVAGALRYFARGDLEAEPESGAILRRYIESAVLTISAMETLLERNRYAASCFHHGIYVPQGLIGETCRRRGVRVVNWNPAYRKSSFIFSHDDSYHRTMLSEPAATWESLAWSKDLERLTMEYLESRRHGSEDWIWFHDEPVEDIGEIAREIGIDFSRPTISLLTSVMWDARLHYGSNAFPDMLSWVLATIRSFASRRDLELVIRVHPAEIRGGIPSRQPIVPEILKAFPVLPPNVHIVGPESRISTYALAERSNAVLLHNTKTGIEVSSLGIPVIVSGEAWIRGKGFSHDATSPEHYLRLLDALPFAERLSPDRLERARKYAYHFFFRRMIPLPFVRQPSRGGGFLLEVSSLEDLLPGRKKGLDVICEGILEGAPFIYPAETLP